MRGKKYHASTKAKRHSIAMQKNALLDLKTLGLDDCDIGSSRTFLSLLNVKGHPVAFIESFETAGINC